MFLAGPERNIPLCLDCNLKLQALQTRQVAELERALNHTVDEMEAIAGFPLGGKFPPRAQPVFVGKAVLNNIHITDSQIGILNTGSIQSIDSAITLVRNGGDPAVASALASLTEGIARDSTLTADQRRDLVDLVSTIAVEAAAPVGKRRSAVVRALTIDIAQFVSGVAGLAQLWSMYGPIIKAHFGIP
jgi:hypothetical protein